ncbi:major facilitator superfamily domain-containing protein [Dactylonectria macrodidyma]|uniref:Major facilitator superfamily domain-containing protein n=1 Tax=Dactylonectria macrodidyma TaxID=307937 RepID=A0A9P9E0I1_9HYPO|nr:major facilitator superfamily domain-containing protein [Dactylonectria macrodidyma]
MPSLKVPFMNRFRLLAVCVANFGNALNDGAAGALIPYMEDYYGIGYGVVSLIFIGQALGFVFAAVVLDSLRAKLGRAKLSSLSQGIMAVAFIPHMIGAPFAVIVVAFFFVGFGLAVNVAMGNIFCGELQNSTFVLGILHSSYGLGGTVGPLIATAFVTVAHSPWARYYILTCGISVISVGLSLWSFWGFEKEQNFDVQAQEASTRENFFLAMIKALKLRMVVLTSIFIFAYQGAEVSISGWVTSFLISARGGDPASVGYVSAGFWAGITLGRLLLSAPAQRVGEKKVVYGFIFGAVTFQLLVWLVPNIIGNAVAVSIVGVLLGPIYPCAVSVSIRGMSQKDALSGMATISACGSLGGALAPFTTGLLAEAVGTFVLHPIVIGLYVVMLICWYNIPTVAKRTE